MQILIRVILLFGLLYVFVCSLDFLSSAFRLLGGIYNSFCLYIKLYRYLKLDRTKLNIIKYNNNVFKVKQPEKLSQTAKFCLTLLLL